MIIAPPKLRRALGRDTHWLFLPTVNLQRKCPTVEARSLCTTFLRRTTQPRTCQYSGGRTPYVPLRTYRVVLGGEWRQGRREWSNRRYVQYCTYHLYLLRAQEERDWRSFKIGRCFNPSSLLTCPGGKQVFNVILSVWKSTEGSLAKKVATMSGMFNGYNNILHDGSSQENIRSASRRMSYSPSTSSTFGLSSSTPPNFDAKKDRRALLEEWRKQAHGRTNTPSPAVPAADSGYTSLSPSSGPGSSSQQESGHKRARSIDEPPNVQPRYGSSAPPSLPRPPSSGQSSIVASFEGLSAIERYRLRKQQELQQQEHNKDNTKPSALLPPHPPHSSSSSSSLLAEESNWLLSSRLSTTSSFNRRLSVTGGAKKARRKSMSVVPMRNLSVSRTPSPIGE